MIVPDNEFGHTVVVDVLLFASDEVVIVLRRLVAYQELILVRLEATKGRTADDEEWHRALGLRSPQLASRQGISQTEAERHALRVALRDGAGNETAFEEQRSGGGQGRLHAAFAVKPWASSAVTLVVTWDVWGVTATYELPTAAVGKARAQPNPVWTRT